MRFDIFGKTNKKEKPLLPIPSRAEILKEMEDLPDHELFALAYYKKKCPTGLASFATGKGFAIDKVKEDFGKDYDVSIFDKK